MDKKTFTISTELMTDKDVKQAEESVRKALAKIVNALYTKMLRRNELDIKEEIYQGMVSDLTAKKDSEVNK